MKKLPKGKNAKKLADVVVDMLMHYKQSIRPIASDNGTEFAEHQFITKKLKTDFLFC